MNAAEWTAVMAATLLGASAQSTVGYGAALFVAPLLFELRPAPEAIVALLALGLALNLAMLCGERRPHVPDRPTVGIILAAALPGIAIGALLVQTVPIRALQILVGATIIAAALVELATTGRVVVRRRPLVGSAGAGLVAGAFTTTTGLKGPPLAIWLARHAQTAEEYRDTVTASLLALNVLGVAMVATVGGGDHGIRGLLVCAALLPATMIGHQLGRHAFRSLNPERHRRLVSAGVVAAGLGSVVAGLA